MDEIKSTVEEFLQDKYNLLFLAVLVVTVAVRIPNLGIQSIWPDASNYLWLSQNLFDPTYLSEISYQGAGLFFLTVKLLSFFLPIFLAGQVASMLYSVAGVAGMYFLGREVGNKEIGLAAALVMGFIPQFWFQSTRPLLDASITSISILCILSLVKYEKTEDVRWGVALATCLIASVFVKIIGVLLFGVVGLYYLFTYRFKIFNMLQERRDMQITVGVLAGFLVFWFGFNYYATGSFLGREVGSGVAGLSGGHNNGRFTGFYLKQLPSMLSWAGIVLLFPGSYLAWKRWKNSETAWLGVALLAVIFIGFHSWHNVNTPRYILPAIPALLLVAFRGLPDRDTSQIKWEYLAAAGVMLIFLYPQGNALIQSKSYSYTGYQEAGAYLQEHRKPGEPVYAGAGRSIRLFSGVPYAEHGGNLHSLPKNRSQLFSALQEGEQRAWVVIDIWEWTQPDWANPPTQKKLQKLQENGLTVEHVVRKQAPTKQGLQEVPAVVILSYTPGSG